MTEEHGDENPFLSKTWLEDMQREAKLPMCMYYPCPEEECPCRKMAGHD